MPISPKHQTLLKPTFIGRKSEIDLFHEIINGPPEIDKYKILSIYGVGGQGKSSLLDQFYTVASKESRKRPIARLNLELAEHRDRIKGLVHIRNQLRKTDLGTYAFDVGFSRYFAITNIGRDITKDYPELFKILNTSSDGLIGELTEILGVIFSEVPGGKLLFSLSHRFTSKVREWILGGGEEILRYIDKLGSQQLIEHLPMLLGTDIHQFALEEKAERPVFLLDAYEALWRESSLGGTSTDTTKDAWIRSLVEECPGAIFIIAGRKKVEWEKIDQDWENIIIGHPLKPLIREDQEKFLNKANISQKDIRRQILETSKGHVLSLEIQASLYNKLNKVGIAPDIQHFAKTNKEILDRFFDHIDPALRGIFRILSVPSKISMVLWGYLSAEKFQAFKHYLPGEVFDEVFFSKSEDGSFLMHELVREHLLVEMQQSNPSLIKDVKSTLVSFYTQEANPDATLAFRDYCIEEATKLILEISPDKYCKWCLDTFSQTMSSNSRYDHLKHAAEHAVAQGIDLVEIFSIAALLVETKPLNPYTIEFYRNALSQADKNPEYSNASKSIIESSETLLLFNKIDLVRHSCNLLEKANNDSIEFLELKLSLANTVGDTETSIALVKRLFSIYCGSCAVYGCLTAIINDSNEPLLIDLIKILKKDLVSSRL